MFAYLLRNKINGKRYIGITRGTIAQRWSVHCKKARLGSKLYIHTAIRKYGPEAFEIIELKQFDDIDEMFDYEAEQILALKPEYNLTGGGKGVRAYSEELRARMRAASRARFQRTEEWERIRKCSEQCRARNAARQIAVIEAKGKVVDALLGMLPKIDISSILRQLGFKRLANRTKLPIRSIGTRAKMSAAAKVRMQTEEGKASIIKAVAARIAAGKIRKCAQH